MQIRYFKLFLNLALLAMILLSVYTSISLNFDRSLWLDEAMLANSFDRSLKDLSSTVLSYNQSAPILYLYIVKIITLIFGNSEQVLRSWSVVSYILLIITSYYLLKNAFNLKLPLLCTAFIANLSILLMYSVEFKPYMSDCFAVVFTILIYFLYKTEKLKFGFVAFFLSLLIWMSNPVCFFIAAILLIEISEGIYSKNISQVRRTIILGAFISISFVIYYLYWLKPIIDNGHMTTYWANKSFPLFPTSKSDIKLQVSLTKELLIHLGYYYKLILFVSLFGFAANIFFFKNRYVYLIYIGIFISLFLSMFGRFPMHDRLFLFIYPLFSILFFFCLDKLLIKNDMGATSISIIISLTILCSTNGILSYKDKSRIIRSNEEANPAIEYIQSKIESSERLFVYRGSVASFLYKNNYNKYDFAGYRDNIILGRYHFNDQHQQIVLDEIDLVDSNAPIYILASHTNLEKARINPLLDSLRNRGHLDLVYDTYDTYVYYFNKE